MFEGKTTLYTKSKLNAAFEVLGLEQFSCSFYSTIILVVSAYVLLVWWLFRGDGHFVRTAQANVRLIRKSMHGYDVVDMNLCNVLLCFRECRSRQHSEIEQLDGHQGVSVCQEL